MIEQIFSELTIALSGNLFIALFAAFAWGVLSILLSPCHLSSIPLVIGYISNQGPIEGKRSFILSLTFAAGILITIAFIGLITASMGRLMGDIGSWSKWPVAFVFFIVGLYLMDLIRWDWNGLMHGATNPRGVFGAVVLGFVFGIGLGPCTFAFLAPVLGIVFQTATDNWLFAVLLLTAFGIGHCAIIVFAGSLTNMVQKYLNWTEESNATLYIKRVAGFLVILGGIYFLYI